MKLYHGSPENLKILKPKEAKGIDEFENQKAIFLTDSFVQAALYAIGKTLKGKTVFALPPNKLIIVGKESPKSGYVYSVNVDAKKGVWDQFSYTKEIRKFKKTKVNPSDFRDKITYIKTKKELLEICKKEKKK